MRMNLALSWVLLLGACGGEEAGDEPPGATTTPEEPADEPSPYIYEEGEDPEPTAALADVEAALQDVVDATLSVHATPVRESYDAAMLDRGDYCPYFYETPDGTYWLDGCTATETGAEFNGYVFAYEDLGIYDPYSGLTVDSWYAYGGATIVDGDGRLMEVGGIALLQEGYGDLGGISFVSWTSLVQGTFAWDGPEADGTWMADGLDPDLVLYAQLAAGAARAVYIDGGFGGLDGWAASFADVVLFDELSGSTCPIEPYGTLSVRSPDGAWYDILFDGTPDPAITVDGADCDGCGVAYYQGEEVGSVCADFSAWLAWGAKPW